MTRHIFLVLLTFCYSYGISQNYCVEYSGYGSAQNINGSETYSYSKNSGTWSNITVRVPMPLTESIKHNSQTITNKQVVANVNYLSSTTEYDNYGNEIQVLNFDGNYSNISVDRIYCNNKYQYSDWMFFGWISINWYNTIRYSAIPCFNCKYSIKQFINYFLGSIDY